MKLLAVLSLCHAVAAQVALLGVDLGTDFTKASLVAPNAPFELVLTPDTQRKDASGLVIKPGDNERIYGSAGKSLATRFPANSLYALKELLGLPPVDLRVGLFSELAPGLDLVPTERNTLGVNVSGTVYSIEEIVAMQLSEVLARGTTMLRDKATNKRAQLKQVVVSVPGHFGAAQRQAVVDAVSLADADLVGLVSDGVAVAINYANSPAVFSKLSADDVHHVLIYDVGASAASATLVGLSTAPGDDGVINVDVKGYGSVIELSGRALTSLVRELILQRFAEAHGPAERTPRLLNRLWREAEKVKQVLSANNDVSVHIEALYDDKDLNMKITRREFEELAEYQASLVAKPINTALGEAGLSTTDLDALLLVGGATRTPFVLSGLADTVGEDKIAKNVNADEANVQGSAMRGVNLSGMYRAKRVFNVRESSSAAYNVEIYTKGNSRPERIEVFPKGSVFGTTQAVAVPRDVESLVLYEGRRRIATWEFPYLSKNVDSLHEPGPYTCVGPAQLRAKFALDVSGLVTMQGVDAVCESVKTEKESTTAEVTYSSVMASAPVGSTEETSAVDSDAEGAATATDPATATTAAATSTSAPSVYPKTRRVAVNAQWEQAPLDAAERTAIRAHLRAMDAKDAERHAFLGVSHELESLAYHLRGLVHDGEESLSAIAGRLLDFVDSGASELEAAKSLLAEGKDALSRATNEAAKEAAEAAEAAKETAAAAAAEAVRGSGVADDVNTTAETGESSADEGAEDVTHEEL